jgi:YVTN family beta-propeller protein
MKKQNGLCIAIGVCFLISLCLSEAAVVGDDSPYLSPCNVVADPGGKVIFIAQKTAKKVAVFDIAKNQVIHQYSFPNPVSGLAYLSTGSQLCVTTAAPQGKVHMIDLEAKKELFTISLGHTPNAPVFSPDGKRLYVCNRFNNNVAVIDLASRKVIAHIPVVREPISAVITPDGKTLYVANQLPAGPTDGAYASAVVSVIDLTQNKVEKNLQLPNGSTSVKELAIAPDGKHVYLTHILARYQLPTTQLERGWMNTNALTVIDAPQKKVINTVLLDNVDLGAANPWGVTCTADGKTICVTQAGTHELSVIDRAQMHDKLTKAAQGQLKSGVSQSAEDVPNDLAFLVGFRRRIKVAGIGPRGIVTIGTQAYYAEYFSDSLGVVDINPAVRPRPKSIPLGPKVAMSKVRQGERLFHDSEICFQKWQSCSSCHPDARVDALNWDLLNDDIGNPKNTKSMLLTHQTPPSMISGVRGTAEDAVRAGIRYIQFAVRPEEDAQAIDEYLKSLQPTPSPYLVKGNLSPAARRGEKLFQQANCASCHSGALYTDMKSYNVGTGRDRETGKKFDTPSLIEAWRTAPYLLDGRAATVRDMVTKFNPRGQHGKTSGLSEQQIEDLVQFVLTR